MRAARLDGGTFRRRTAAFALAISSAAKMAPPDTTTHVGVHPASHGTGPTRIASWYAAPAYNTGAHAALNSAPAVIALAAPPGRAARPSAGITTMNAAPSAGTTMSAVVIPNMQAAPNATTASAGS